MCNLYFVIRMVLAKSMSGLLGCGLGRCPTSMGRWPDRGNSGLSRLAKQWRGISKTSPGKTGGTPSGSLFQEL